MNNLQLKIFETNPFLAEKHPTEILATAIELLNGLTKAEPEFFKGTKIGTNYSIGEDKSNVAVRQSYEDVYNEYNFLLGVNMKIEWFDTRNNPALQKIVFVPYSVQEASEAISARRKRQINYLQEAGARAGVKQYIDMLFNYYSTQLVGEKTVNLLNNYIENGSKDFQTAIENETSPQILQILKAKLPDGSTVKQSIFKQIT